MAPSSTGSEFGYPQWTMREPQQQNQQQQMTVASAARKPVQKTHSIDRLSMSSQGSVGSGSNYDSPKSVLTSSTAISSGQSRNRPRPLIENDMQIYNPNASTSSEMDVK